MNHKTLLLWIFLQCAAALFSPALGDNAVLEGADSGLDELSTDSKSLAGTVKYSMRKSLDLDHEGCNLKTGEKECLEECGFNATAKTIFIIHGWTMSGMFESWMHKLVSAVMQRENEANVVIVDWLSMAQQLYPDAVNYTHTVGLDIAAMLNWLQDERQLPLENVHLIGYSLGAHVAGYAGTFVEGTIGRITDFMEVMKCEHERAVHLFVDSLMNKDHMSFAFQCTGPDRFKKGICLSCRKNRCNNIGYNARKMRKRRNSKMYLKTRADTPFGGDHDDTVGLNLTNTFLVFTESEIGDLLKIRLIWEGDTESWNSVWKNIKKTFWAWNTKPPKPVLEVRRIRVKSGETQKKSFGAARHEQSCVVGYPGATCLTD
eukprot:superscaffoldBa00001498_g10824